MSRLSEQLLEAETFERVVADCRALVEAEVARRGVVVRAAFGLAQRAKPGLVERALRNLVPDFARELDPFHAAYRTHGEGSFRDYVVARGDEIAAALLHVTDRRIEQVQSGAVRTAYARLRGRAEREVLVALPGVITIVVQHLERLA